MLPVTRCASGRAAACPHGGRSCPRPSVIEPQMGVIRSFPSGWWRACRLESCVFRVQHDRVCIPCLGALRTLESSHQFGSVAKVFENLTSSWRRVDLCVCLGRCSSSFARSPASHCVLRSYACDCLASEARWCKVMCLLRLRCLDSPFARRRQDRCQEVPQMNGLHDSHHPHGRCTRMSQPR